MSSMSSIEVLNSTVNRRYSRFFLNRASSFCKKDGKTRIEVALELYAGARVVYGKLYTQRFRSKHHRANRKVKRIPHRKLGSILEAKCGAGERSEAYTTKLGEKISPRVGRDVHKCAAAAFALSLRLRGLQNCFTLILFVG